MKDINSLILGIDFDGTCVTHDYPNVGKDIGAQKVLKRLIQNKHKLILHTMRSDINHIEDAITWFMDNEIELYGINKNREQWVWTNSPKPHCNFYIDDAAIGTPLKFDINLSNRPFVDWGIIEIKLEQMGILKND